MKELNEHGDGFEEYYYSKDREEAKDDVEATEVEQFVRDGMEKLGYSMQYINFGTGCCQFVKIDPITRDYYRISVGLDNGKCMKIKATIYSDNSHSAGDMFPFTDDERYLVFKLMDEYDRIKENEDGEF